MLSSNLILSFILFCRLKPSSSPCLEFPHLVKSVSPCFRSNQWNCDHQHCSPWWDHHWNQQPVFSYCDALSAQSGLNEIGSNVGATNIPFYPHTLSSHYHYGSTQVTQAAVYDCTLIDPSFYCFGEFELGHLARGCLGPAIVDPTLSFVQQTPSRIPIEHYCHNGYDHYCGDFNEDTAGCNSARLCWGHLDHANLAMTGFTSPGCNAAPRTPRREATHMRPESHDVIPGSIEYPTLQPYYARWVRFLVFGIEL